MILKAFQLNDSNTVVTDKKSVKGAIDNDFEEITLIIPFKQIKDMSKRIAEDEKEMY